jgi:hypothetical protein
MNKTIVGVDLAKMLFKFVYIRHSASLLGINFLIDVTHAINNNTVPLFHI